MPREKADYRDVLERILLKFDNRESLSIIDCCEYTGLNRKTLLKDRTFPAQKVAGKYIINAARLARWLS